MSKSGALSRVTPNVTAIDEGYAVALEESVGVSDEVAIRVLSTLRSQVAEAIGVGDEVTITVRPVPPGPTSPRRSPSATR